MSTDASSYCDSVNPTYYQRFDDSGAAPRIKPAYTKGSVWDIW